MENLKINIQELALLMDWAQPAASAQFKSFCTRKDLPYKKGMEISITDLGIFLKLDLIERANSIRTNYLKYSEQRSKPLNDKRGIAKGKLKAPQTALMKFLRPEDVKMVQENWKTKNDQLNNQMSFI